VFGRLEEGHVTEPGSASDGGDRIPRGITDRSEALALQLRALLTSPGIPFDDRCHSAIPEDHGVYRIFDRKRPEETVRAGRTKVAAKGLRQRVYGNHLMGNQTGNLRAQLVAGGVTADLDSAKRYIRDALVVQILVVPGVEERRWLEHFMLGVLQPQFCD
jgi:hypothetical protein